MDNTVKFGKKPIGVYLSNIMGVFENNHKAIVEYVETRRERVNRFFQKLEQGGFLVSKEYGKEKSYLKIVHFFQTTNGRSVMVEYFPEDDNLRVKGELSGELGKDRGALIKFLEENGTRQQNKMWFYWREVNKK